ncbi:DHA2 family efflux MFS transporter permease subunit [Nocardioides lijunqiniae]|uniref:DHA2 family efflux MFS transporter permease subunit n=1 Tax=Nocardioides lijunqiniae TaxID=2760832 RepID=UPI001877873D|nr:DHA2 family efflux MFS transporter permease subunit [Nocardioides lijunqiniae]
MDKQARLIGLILALGGLLVTVDTTVVLVAVPAIVADFNASVASVQWATTGYLLGVVAVIPLAAWASRRFGARRVFVTALGVFTTASVLAGLSWNVASLTTFRVLQGLGGGLLIPLGHAIGLRTVAREARGRMMSILGLPVLIGPVLGPPLAGALIDSASWRWVFLINVPVGLAGIILCLRFVPRQPVDPAARGRVDVLGLVLLSGGASLLVLSCTKFAESGVLDPIYAALGLAAIGMLAGFVVHALRSDDPLVDLRLLRHGQLGTGLAVVTTFGAAYFGASSILPVFVQSVRGDSAGLAGMIAIPQALAVGLTMQVATRLVDRVDPHRIVTCGVTLGLLGVAGLFFTTTADAPYGAIVCFAVVLSIGSGATILPTMTLALRDLEGDDTARGTTLVGTAQHLASALGSAGVAAALTISIRTRAPSVSNDPGGRDGVGAMLELDADQRGHLLPELAQAVGAAYLLPVALAAMSAFIALSCMRSTQKRAHDSSTETEIESTRP